MIADLEADTKAAELRKDQLKALRLEAARKFASFDLMRPYSDESSAITLTPIGPSKPEWSKANDGAEGVQVGSEITCMGRTFEVVEFNHANGHLTIRAREVS